MRLALGLSLIFWAAIFFIFGGGIASASIAGIMPELDEDIFGAVMALITNYKTMGMLAAIIAVLNIVMKVLKSSFIPASWFSDRTKLWRRLVVVTVGVILGIGTTVVTGGSILPAVFAGLISSGGAMTIYHALKDALDYD